VCIWPGLVTKSGFFSIGWLASAGVFLAPKTTGFLVNAKPVDAGDARRKVMARTFKVVLVALVVLALAGSAYAFAAANTVEPGGAGYKASEIAGYAIDNVVYDLNDTDPTKLAKIIFDIAPIAPNTAAAAYVKINTAATASFISCTISGTTTITATCATTANVVDVVKLDIVASSSLNPGP
jgi:hypothetical protein